MAKDRSDKEKKEKKEKKRSETDGVHKKSKKEKKNVDLLEKAVEQELASRTPDADAVMVNGDGSEERPLGALVPFANPLAEDKVAKKVLKSVKKGEFSRCAIIAPVHVESYGADCYFAKFQLLEARP